MTAPRPRGKITAAILLASAAGVLIVVAPQAIAVLQDAPPDEQPAATTTAPLDTVLAGEEVPPSEPDPSFTLTAEEAARAVAIAEGDELVDELTAAEPIDVVETGLWTSDSGERRLGALVVARLRDPIELPETTPMFAPSPKDEEGLPIARPDDAPYEVAEAGTTWRNVTHLFIYVRLDQGEGEVVAVQADPGAIRTPLPSDPADVPNSGE